MLGYLSFINVYLEYGSQLEVVLFPRGQVTTSKLYHTERRKKRLLASLSRESTFCLQQSCPAADALGVGTVECPLRCLQCFQILFS